MGNCFVSKIGNSNPSISDRSITSGPSTAGTSNNYSNDGGCSATSSSEGTCCDGEMGPTPTLKIYSFADLKRSTANFNSDSVLGEGGFGTVFRGWVDKKTLMPGKFGTGMIVAIKKWNSESMEGFKEWESEVNFLGRLSHPNLVKLLGYCWEDNERLVVYEFLQQGSLENHLFKKNPASEPLSWDIRLKIAIGAARGLTFLHSSEVKIIHRDFNASNVLLDANYNTKISAFGLAKLGPSGGNTHVTTQTKGTNAYCAPEYNESGRFSTMSDVYSFGVVLLEMLSGLRAGIRISAEHNLIDWARPCLSHETIWKTIMDVRIEGKYSSQAAFQVAKLSGRCLEHEPRRRPSMKEVVEELEQIQAIKKEP